MQTIHIASDHAGYALKEHLVQFLAQKGINVVDDGTHSTESCDYPVLAHKLCAAVEKEQGTGILICGTGIGISIAANKIHGIRAALCADVFSALMSREHNDANILCLGERTLGVGHAEMIVDTWLHGVFQGGRHACRTEKITKLDKAR